MHDIVQVMVGYYNDRASVYDHSMGYDNVEVVHRHANVIQALCRQLQGRDVLEIASGPGFWTSQVAPHCRSVLATDINPSTHEEARKKFGTFSNVRLQLQDAYDLQGISQPLSGAFAVDWWSHIPKSKIAAFLESLHRNLSSGARVVMIDQLDTPHHPSKATRRDADDNLIEPRRIANGMDGRTYEIIKNYPTEEELKARIGKNGADFFYMRDLDVSRWVFAYTVVR